MLGIYTANRKVRVDWPLVALFVEEGDRIRVTGTHEYQIFIEHEYDRHGIQVGYQPHSLMDYGG
jgi:hypothetical protein